MYVFKQIAHGFSTGSPPHGVRTPKSRLTGTARFTIHLILQRVNTP